MRASCPSVDPTPHDAGPAAKLLGRHPTSLRVFSHYADGPSEVNPTSPVTGCRVAIPRPQEASVRFTVNGRLLGLFAASVLGVGTQTGCGGNDSEPAPRAAAA